MSTAADIALEGPGAALAKLPVTGGLERQTDLAVSRHVGRRAGLGAVVFGLAGAAAGAVIGALIGGAAVAAAGALAVGALAFGLGFLWGGFSGLAADEAFADTFVAVGDTETVLVVHHPADSESVVRTLRKTKPSSLRVA